MGHLKEPLFPREKCCMSTSLAHLVAAEQGTWIKNLYSGRYDLSLGERGELQAAKTLSMVD